MTARRSFRRPDDEGLDFGLSDNGFGAAAVEPGIL